jgi:hypothetical protein
VNRRVATIRGDAKVPTRLLVHYHGEVAKGSVWLEHNGGVVDGSERDNLGERALQTSGVWFSPAATGPWAVRVRGRGAEVADLRLSVNVVTA